MLCSLLKIGIFVISLAGSMRIVGQKETCDLGLTVFSYDRLDSPRDRLINVSVQLSGEGTNEKSVVSDSADATFRGLKRGNYKVSFQAAGYKRRSKAIDLDCDLADEKSIVWNATYLWRDKKIPANDADLVSNKIAESSDSTSKTITSLDKGIFGKVKLELVIDGDGNVISASRIDGDKRLASRAIKMAKQSKFSPTLIGGMAVEVKGSLTYNFVP